MIATTELETALMLRDAETRVDNVVDNSGLAHIIR